MAPLGERDVVEAYRVYFPALKAKCARMLADPVEAQDVAQETFTRLWRSRLDLADRRAVVRWLYTTSTRLAVDRLKAAGRWTGEDREWAGRPDEPERLVGARRTLRRLAADLPAADLQLLVLWRLDGLGQAEIGDLLGMSERTVRRRLRAAEARLERVGGSDG